MTRRARLRRLAARTDLAAHHEGSLRASRDAFESVDDLVEIIALGEVTRGATAKRGSEEAIANMRAQEDEARIGMQVMQPISDLEDIRSRHLDVEHYHIGAMEHEGVDDMIGTRERSHAADLPVHCKLRLQAFDEQEVIVNAQHSNQRLLRFPWRGRGERARHRFAMRDRPRWFIDHCG